MKQTTQKKFKVFRTLIRRIHISDRILIMCLEAGTSLSEERLLKNIVEAFPIRLFKMQLPDKSRTLKQPGYKTVKSSATPFSNM